MAGRAAGKLMIAALICGSPLSAESPGKPVALPEYRPEEQITGSFSMAGSGIMASLLRIARKQFTAIHAEASIELSFPSSATVLEGLLTGRVKLGAMSRPMGKLEKKAFARTFGREILEVCVAQDALQILVHRLNPITSLTLEQLDAIYSPAGLRGAAPATTWGDLGVGGSWELEPIEAYGGAPGWGTTLTFESLVTWGALSKPGVHQVNIESGVPEAVATNLGAIGYTCLGPLPDDARAVPVAENAASAPVDCTPANLQNGSYPLRRQLYLYIAPEKDGSISPASREFLLFLLSRNGQAAVADSGMAPLSGKQVRDQRNALSKFAP
jgi:phosphate transport system substrate-binding protein